MPISEPMTLATDYALGAVAAVLGLRLRPVSSGWALALLAVAAAAFLGGTWHGLIQSELLWKATLLAAGVASCAMVVGSARLTAQGTLLQALLILAAVTLALYSVWVLLNDDFLGVIADSGLSLALVGALHLWRRDGWMIVGVATSVAAALVQATGVGLHAHFNHNDLYHVMQALALFFFYRGVVAASGERAPVMSGPDFASRKAQ